MGDGRLNRALEQGKARTTDIKGRVPDLKDRVPELKERGAELKERGLERSAELRTRGGELARQYAKMDVSWARMPLRAAAREGLLSGVLGPMTDWYLRRRAVGREVFDDLQHPVVFVANHSSHLDTPTILRAIPRRGATAPRSPPPPTTSTRSAGRPTASPCSSTPCRSAATAAGSATGATDHVDRLIERALEPR